MKKAFLLFTVCLAAGLTSLARGARNIGDVTVGVDARMLSVSVSANTPELNALAREAFNSNGRYHLVPGYGQFNIHFTLVASREVRVDITRGAGRAQFYSQVVRGTSDRNALLRAADVAVEKTNMMGLKGYFASKIAFISERTGHREVYVSDLFFGDVQEITHDRALALGPRWYPDGSRIVYTSYFHSGFPDIFEINLRTYQRTTFASFRGTNTGARFSPNGQMVAEILSGAGNPDLYVGNAQGQRLRQLTHTDAVEASPCFSPDSSEIVYTSDAAGGPQLYVISARGGAPRRLPTAISNYCAEPDWSRGNPNKIAFTIRIGSGYQIAVYDMRERRSQQVSRAPYDGVEPAWLADGRHLLYVARNPSQSRICLLDTETGKTTVISPAALGAVSSVAVLDPR